jgi:RNA polymerase sigma-70 factor (ECF subfamily)
MPLRATASPGKRCKTGGDIHPKRQPGFNRFRPESRQVAWPPALQVLTRLQAEQEAAGKAAQFEHLRDSLMGDPAALRHAELGARLGMSDDAVKTAVSRLRRRYRELLREEIAHTVSGSAEVEEEIRHLFVVVGS